MKKEKKSKKPADKKNSKKKNDKKKEILKTGEPQKEKPAAASKSRTDLRQALAGIADQYHLIEDLPRFYGGEIPLYISETSALRVIGSTPGLNLTAIAAALDVSKSAVSKSTGKLMEKGLITKERALREVIFNLSEQGQTLYDQMSRDEKQLFKGLDTYLKALSPADEKIISAFLAHVSQDLEKAVNKLREPLDAIDEK